MLQKIVTLLYLSGEPLHVEVIAKMLATSPEEVLKHKEELSLALNTIGLALLYSKDGFSIVTKPEQAPLVETFWTEELQGDLTPAALQVLTLVAYLGSPTREEISYIRGVQSSQSVRTLTVRGLVARSGEVCTLTGEALTHLGVTNVEELPDYGTLHASLIEKLQARNG